MALRRYNQPSTSTQRSRGVRAARQCALRSGRRPGALRIVAQAPPFLGSSDPNPDFTLKPTPSQAPTAPGQSYSSALLLQGFAWDSWSQGDGNWYGILKSKIPEIKAAGVTHIWLPPPSHSVSNEGYLPGQLYDLQSKYGNEEQLIELNAALREAGIKPLADIVINHRCADEQEDGVYNDFRDKVDHVGASIDWGRWAITSNDPHFNGTGNPDTGDDFAAAPDLDHANPELRAALKDWLSWLQKDIGFTGWRFDYVRGYGAEYITEYVDATTGADSLNVGEFWTEAQWWDGFLDYNQNGARQRLCDWIRDNGERCTAFDFPTKSILQEAVKHCEYNRLRDPEGKAPGLLGWWPSRTVTFIENHDTGSTQQHWPFPSHGVIEGYAYILTHPGIPCIFWDHLFTWGDEVRQVIMDLAALRQRVGVVADSPLEILAADADLYLAKVAGSLILKLGSRFDLGSLLPREEDGWACTMAGHDWAIWELKPQPQPQPQPQPAEDKQC